MQNHAIPCNIMQYHAIPCNTMQYHAIPCKTMQYYAKPCHTMQYHAISCNTMQYHAIPCIINNCWQSVPLPCGQYMAIFWHTIRARINHEDQDNCSGDWQVQEQWQKTINDWPQDRRSGWEEILKQNLFPPKTLFLESVVPPLVTTAPLEGLRGNVKSK